MPNHARSLSLASSDREELERLQRSSACPAGLNRRARAVLLMADEIPGSEVARFERTYGAIADAVGGLAQQIREARNA